MSRPIRVHPLELPHYDGPTAGALVRCKYIVVHADDHELLVLFPSDMTHDSVRARHYPDHAVIAAGHITYDRDHDQPLHHVVAEGNSTSIDGCPRARPTDTIALNDWLRQPR